MDEGVPVEGLNVGLACAVESCIFSGSVYLGLSYVSVAEEELPVEIVHVYHVVIQQEQFPHSQTQQVDSHYRSQAAHSEHEHSLFLQLSLVPVVDSHLAVEGPSQKGTV